MNVSYAIKLIDNQAVSEGLTHIIEVLTNPNYGDPNYSEYEGTSYSVICFHIFYTMSIYYYYYYYYNSLTK